MYNNYRTTYTVRPAARHFPQAVRPTPFFASEEDLGAAMIEEARGQKPSPLPSNCTTRESVYQLMKDRRPRTVEDVARKLKLTYVAARMALVALRKDGLVSVDIFTEAKSGGSIAIYELVAS